MSTFDEKVARLREIWRKQRHDKELKETKDIPTSDELEQLYLKSGEDKDESERMDI